MKRFLIHVSTYWCGMDNTFRAEAESELELDEIADQLAYDNFQSYGCEADMEEFYEDDDYLSPQENGGRATHEVYSAKDDVLLYSNKGECTSLMGEMGL